MIDDSYVKLGMSDNPFVSLPPVTDYATSFRQLFCAREAEVRNLCRNVRQPHAVFLTAPYGGGKSVVLLESLVRLAEAGFITFYGTYDRELGFLYTMMGEISESTHHLLGEERVELQYLRNKLQNLRRDRKKVVVAVDDLDRAADIFEIKKVTDDVRDLIGNGTAVVLTGQPFGVTYDLKSSAGVVFHSIEIPTFSAADFEEMLRKYLAAVHISSELTATHPFSHDAAKFICEELAAAKLTPRVFNFVVTELLELAVRQQCEQISLATVHKDWRHVADTAVRGLTDLQLRHLDVILSAKVVSEDSEKALEELGEGPLAEYPEIVDKVLLPLIEKNLLRVQNKGGKDQFELVPHATFALENLKNAALTATENSMPPFTGNEPAVVLITVNDHETDALLDVFLGPRQTPVPASRGGVTYHELGVHGGLRVIHSLCEMGAGGIGAAQQRAQDAIAHWQPRAVIAVGIAFGIDETKQRIGDVLVSVQLQDYELARLNPDGTLTPRGDKAHASDTLVNRFRQTDIRCRRAADDWPKVRFGLVLSGQKLVDNLDYRESLKRLAPEAIGGEMEGTGLYTSAQRAGADWLVVKAICDWGHNKNQADKDAWQKTAAANAARVVKAALDAGDLYPLAAAELPQSVTATEQPAVRSDGDRNPTTDSAATEPNVLLETLKQLPGPWFEELVFKFDQHNSVPTGVAQTVRAIELLKVLRMTERGFQAAAAEITRLKERSQ